MNVSDPWFRLLSIALLMGGAFFAGGCGDEGDPPATADVDSAADESSDLGSAESSSTRGDTIEIVMDEYLIDVPDTLPAGRLVFNVRNGGFEEHNLEVHRDSLLFELARPLNPGEETSVEVELEPGPYRLICTVSGHEGRGMSVPIVVVGDGQDSP